MRTLLIATAAMALATAGAASAQRMATRGPGMGAPQPTSIGAGMQAPRPGRPGPRPVGRGIRPPSHNWGSTGGGRWSGAVYAPGGINAYRRPVRGFLLPTYWASPSFFVNDWSAYHLSQPPAGYGWSRYYDDAVLIDHRGSVHDSVANVDWAGSHDDGGYEDGGYRDGGEPYDGYHHSSYGEERRGSGVGGAVVGGVAGGIAGNLIAGRGNRLGGTLIGAGVGTAAGYAIDRTENRRAKDRRAKDRGRPGPHPASGYGAGYPRPGSYGQPGYGNGATVVTSGPTGLYTVHSGGYYDTPASVTTVTVASAPTITTSMTETYEDVVTYTRPAPRKVYGKTWKARRKEICGCR